MNLNLTHATRIGLNVMALLGLSVTLYLGRMIIIPLIISVILAAILYPTVGWLYRRVKIPWVPACFIAISGLVIANLVVFGSMVSIVLKGLPNPNQEETQREVYSDIRLQMLKILPLEQLNEVLPSDPNESKFYGYFRKTLQGELVTGKLIELGQYGATWLYQSILILFVLLFLLMEGDMLAKRIKEIFGESSEIRSEVSSALAEMGEAVRAYLIWRTVVNLGLGVFLGIVYSTVGLKQPWIWAMFTAVLCYIPYIGTMLAGFPPVLDALINVSPFAAIGILLFYMVVVTVEGYIIVPVVMGRSMDLNATTVMIACLFWELLWGIPGLFLAMPLMAAVRAVCLHVEGWRAWGNLMSTERGAEEVMALARAKLISANLIESAADATVVMESREG